MKARVKTTGEIGDVLCWDDVGKTKLSILLKGNVCTIPYQNIEIIQLESNINWEQRRYEIAKSMMAAFLSNSCSNVYMNTYENQAQEAVKYADALIEELKKGK